MDVYSSFSHLSSSSRTRTKDGANALPARLSRLPQFRNSNRQITLLKTPIVNHDLSSVYFISKVWWAAFMFLSQVNIVREHKILFLFFITVLSMRICALCIMCACGRAVGAAERRFRRKTLLDETRGSTLKPLVGQTHTLPVTSSLFQSPRNHHERKQEKRYHKEARKEAS